MFEQVHFFQVAQSKSKHRVNLPFNQSAFTIVELLIASLLGIILTAGIIQLFVGSNRNFSLQNELANIQEDGRFAMIFLENEIQKGSSTAALRDPVPLPINLALSQNGVTDSIAVSYTVPIDGVSNRDCNGSVVASGIIVNQFFVGGTNGDELLCLGNGGGAAQPLINGVKDFQVLYGLIEPKACPDGVVNHYVTLDQLAATPYDGDEPSLKPIVASVRVALLISSEEDVLLNAENKSHSLLDTQIVTNDRLAYRTFQQTIFMPNTVYVNANDSLLSCAGPT